jgi:hypothetical protein
MIYEDFEYSVDDGAPIELYSFECGVPELNFYYTTGYETVSHAGRTFIPAHVSRGPIDEVSAISAPQSVSIDVALNTDLARWYGIAHAPPTLEVRIWRGHDGSGEFRKMFWGVSERFTVRNEMLSVSVKPFVQSLLHRKMATNRYAHQCQHTLFDNRCKVPRAAHTWETTVTAISDDGLYVTVANQFVGNDELRIGDIKVNGEERVILGNQDNVIKVRYPFTIIDVGMAAELSRGCNKLKQTCKNVYNNFHNFGGFPLIPDQNIINAKAKTYQWEKQTKDKSQPPERIYTGGSHGS